MPKLPQAILIMTSDGRLGETAIKSESGTSVHDFRRNYSNSEHSALEDKLSPSGLQRIDLKIQSQDIKESYYKQFAEKVNACTSFIVTDDKGKHTDLSTTVSREQAKFTLLAAASKDGVDLSGAKGFENIGKAMKDKVFSKALASAYADNKITESEAKLLGDVSKDGKVTADERQSLVNVKTSRGESQKR